MTQRDFHSASSDTASITASTSWAKARTLSSIDRGDQQREFHLVLADDGRKGECRCHVMPSWLGPRPPDDFGGALVKQFQPDRTAQFAWAIGRPRARHLDELTAARFVEHGSRQRHLGT